MATAKLKQFSKEVNKPSASPNYTIVLCQSALSPSKKNEVMIKLRLKKYYAYLKGRFLRPRWTLSRRRTSAASRGPCGSTWRAGLWRSTSTAYSWSSPAAGRTATRTGLSWTGTRGICTSVGISSQWNSAAAWRKRYNNWEGLDRLLGIGTAM